MSGTDYTLTPNYGLYKPIPDADINGWGGHLNTNSDTLDSLLSGKFGQVCNVRDYGALGNTRGTKDAAMTAGLTTLTSATMAFTSADVGKAIMVFGTGAGGVTQHGTITAVTSGTAVTTSFTAVTTASAQTVWVGTDDTAAVTAAIAASRTRNTICHFPPGCYWLASQSVPITLTNATLHGEGKSAEFFPYNGGSSIFINNTVSPAAFTGVAGCILERLTFFYPQVNAALSPVAFPPLFQADGASAGEVNNWFASIRITNAWQAFHSAAGGSWARTWMTSCFVFGIDAVFYMQNGYADVLQIENCYFGYAAWPEAQVAPYAVRNYTVTSGAVLKYDLAATSGYSFADGLIMTNCLFQTYRYGLYLLSGTVDVSNISNVNFDGVGSALRVTGTGRITSMAISGGEAYSSNPSDPAASAYMFHFDTSATPNELTISGMHLTSSFGGYIWDALGAISSLTLTGNSFMQWGQSTTPGTYYAMACPSTMTGSFVISGNLFFGNRAGTSNSVEALYCPMGAGVTMTITGNNFVACTVPIAVSGSAGTMIASGNVSSVSGAPVSDTTTGTALAMLEDNCWDIKPTLRAPTVTAGPGAAVVAGSSNRRGQFTTGTGTVTSGTLTFTTPLPYPPLAVMLSATTTGATLGIASIGVNGFQFGASASIPSTAVFYDVKM